MQLIMTMVIRALRDSGCRNTLTPLEMASVPVRAEPPEANALSSDEGAGAEEDPRPWMTDRDRTGLVDGVGVELSQHGLVGAHHDEHGHVDDEEVGGDGEDPPRLADAAQVAVADEYDQPDGDPVVPGTSAGNTEVSAATPAATDTATVRE